MKFGFNNLHTTSGKIDEFLYLESEGSNVLSYILHQKPVSK